MFKAEGYRAVGFNSHVGGREYLPDDFKEYVDRELNCLAVLCDEDNDNETDGYIVGWVFWSREDDEPDDIVDFKNKIKDVLLPKCIHYCSGFILVQFWAPMKTTEGRISLSTRHQPFALNIDADTCVGSLDIKNLCGYRMICKDYTFYMDGVEEELGVPGRVFKRGLPECTPNVEYYSTREYPLRNQALSCQVAQSFAFPVFEPAAQTCVGVLEFITPASTREYSFLEDLDRGYSENLKEKAGLIFSVPLEDHYKQLNTGENIALEEITAVLKVVCTCHDLPLALAWTSCKVDMACGTLVNGDMLYASCFGGQDIFYFSIARDMHHHLRKGQGVAGRAFSSPNVLLCTDLTQLSITEYPLAHYARHEGLCSCFAICLQSSCTGNDLYVLEFFMPPPSNKAPGNLQTTLILSKILETMKRNFPTFKLASGKELGEELRIEEIHFQNGEKLDPLRMSQTTRSLPRLEPLQSGEEMTLSGCLDQQPMGALDHGSRLASALQSNIYATCSQEKGIKKMRKRAHNKTGKYEIPLEDIRRT